MKTFKEQLNDDISAVFLNEDFFAIPATWHKYAAAGPPVTYTDVPLSVLFDTPYTATRAQKEAGNARTTATCKSSELTGMDKSKDRFEVEGVNYYIAEMQPDGTGLTVLVLTEDEP